MGVLYGGHIGRGWWCGCEGLALLLSNSLEYLYQHREDGGDLLLHEVREVVLAP